MPGSDFNCPITRSKAVPAHPEQGSPPQILFSGKIPFFFFPVNQGWKSGGNWDIAHAASSESWCSPPRMNNINIKENFSETSWSSCIICCSDKPVTNTTLSAFLLFFCFHLISSTTRTYARNKSTHTHTHTHLQTEVSVCEMIYRSILTNPPSSGMPRWEKHGACDVGVWINSSLVGTR